MKTKRFYGVSETAEILGVSHTTITAAIDQGKLPALILTGSHQSTRIAHETLFPSETLAKDLKTQRIKRMVLDLKRKQEVADRLCRDWGEAQMTANAALQALADELGMQEVDAAFERIAS